MKTYIYGIIDTKAKDIVGGLQLHKHDAPAIRLFGDIAATKDTAINLHPEDYDLYKLGQITDDNCIEPLKELILTGKTWISTQNNNA